VIIELKNKKRLKIPQWYSTAVYQRRIDNEMTKKKKRQKDKQ